MRSSFEGTTKREVARQFGRAFAERLFELPVETWQGPVESGFGLHLVRISAHSSARGPSFEDVAFEVRSAYLDQRRREIRAAVFADLRRRYAIEIPGSDQVDPR
jgi:peptidyl-prolyl cis-trans isomerase C